MAKYRAIKKGFDGVCVREPGSVFEFSGVPGKWMKLVDEKKEHSEKPVKHEVVEEKHHAHAKGKKEVL